MPELHLELYHFPLPPCCRGWIALLPSPSLGARIWTVVHNDRPSNPLIRSPLSQLTTKYPPPPSNPRASSLISPSLRQQMVQQQQPADPHQQQSSSAHIAQLKLEDPHSAGPSTPTTAPASAGAGGSGGTTMFALPLGTAAATATAGGLQRLHSADANVPLDPSSSFSTSASSSSGHHHHQHSGGSLTCTVCGDMATGRHYGSVACNGCKGFFRRTIRRNYKYTCRFNSNCQIDKHNRAVCRACRYTRCIQFGMKVDAVQSERDLIGKRSRSFSNASAMAGSPSTQQEETLSPAGTPAPAAAVGGGQKGSGGFAQDKAEQQQQTAGSLDQSASADIPSCSSTGSGHQATGGGGHFLTQSQHFPCVDSDEPVPRKRSFSSGSRFDQEAQQQGTTTTAPPTPRFPLATVKMQQQQQQPQAANQMGERYQQQQQQPEQSTSARQQQQRQQSAAENTTDLLEDPWSGRNGRALLRQLLCSEEKIQSMREAVIAQTCKMEYMTKGETADSRRLRMPFGGGGGNGTSRRANENDILQSLHSQLLLVIEWAKTLKPFADLPTEDQTALLKNFAAQHVVLCVAYRSTSDFLKLINDSCIPRIANGDDKDLFYRKDAERVMDLLVSPMRWMRIDDVEFVAMKACILFNPVARGLSAQSVMKVLQTRRHIFRALQHYVQAKSPPDEDRIGDLTFFVLSPLQSLAKAVSEDVLVGKLSGVARLDQLMEELILEDSEPKESNSLGPSAGGAQGIVGGQQQQSPSAAELSRHSDSNFGGQSADLIGTGQSGGGIEQNTSAVQLGGGQPLFLSSVPGNSPTQWHSHPNSPPQHQDGGGGGHFHAPLPPSLSGSLLPQRSRHLSSSASSSSNSSPLLQPVPLGFASAGLLQRGPLGHQSASSAAVCNNVPVGPLSPINESDFASSALTSYVFGASLQDTSRHPFAIASGIPQPIAANNNISAGGRDVLLSAPAQAVHHHPLSSPPSSQQQFFSAIHFRPAPASTSATGQQQPTTTAAAESAVPSFSSSSHHHQHHYHHQQHQAAVSTEFWPQHMGSGLLFTTTPSTPSAAIYSGTSPSPPQRFGIGGTKGGG